MNSLSSESKLLAGNPLSGRPVPGSAGLPAPWSPSLPGPWVRGLSKKPLFPTTFTGLIYLFFINYQYFLMDLLKDYD